MKQIDESGIEELIDRRNLVRENRKEKRHNK
jgi:hypothetical protein